MFLISKMAIFFDKIDWKGHTYSREATEILLKQSFYILTFNEGFKSRL